MKSFLLSLLLPALALGACMAAQAQTRKPALPADTVTSEVILQDLLYRHPPDEKVFGHYEQQPEFPGGTHAMYKFIQTHLRVPSKARKAGISGRVFTSFIIQVTGEITNVTVLKGLGFGCDEEAVRVVQLMPRWKPGKQRDKIMKVKYNLPISFNTK